MSHTGSNAPRVPRRASAVLVGIALVVGCVSGAAYAGGTRTIGGSVSHVYVVTSTNSRNFVDDTYRDVPGSGLSVSVPSGQHALTTARFSAVSKCYDGVHNFACKVRILADSTEMNPQSAAIDFDSSSTDEYESHAMERSIVLGPGTHVIKVQAAVSVPTGTLSLSFFHLTVETSKA